METKEKQLPPRHKTVTISQINYNIPYPNTGQFIDITARKSMYSSGQQGRFNMSSVSGMYSYYLVDAIAFYDVVLPALRKDLNVESIFDLDMIESKNLVDVYVKDITPWLDEWSKILNTFDEEEEEPKKSKKNG